MQSEFQKSVQWLVSNEDFKIFAEAIFDPGALKDFMLSVRFIDVAEDIIVEADFDSYRSDAMKDAKDFDGLNYALALRILNGLPLSPSMLKWISSILSRTINRPKSYGRAEPTSRRIRDLNLIHYVAAAKKFGLPPTRNAASPALSACDAVVEGMAQLGGHISYDLVAKAWSWRSRD